jgi:DNA-binding CsgD family transcriptional regulator/DNA-binding XRE family transcriptional regulator
MPLTDRELELLQYIAEGDSNGEAGDKCEPAISEDTVKSHLANVYVKLGARSRAHAVSLAHQSGVLSADTIEAVNTAAPAIALATAPGTVYDIEDDGPGMDSRDVAGLYVDALLELVTRRSAGQDSDDPAVWVYVKDRVRWAIQALRPIDRGPRLAAVIATACLRILAMETTARTQSRALSGLPKAMAEALARRDATDDGPARDHALMLAAIGAHLKLYREWRNRTQAEFADQVDLCRRTVYTYEAGTRTSLTVLQLLQICEALGISPSALLSAAQELVERTRASDSHVVGVASG